MKRSAWVLVLLVLAAAAAALWWWMRERQAPLPAAAPAASAPAPATSAPASQAIVLPQPESPLAASEVPSALEGLLGRKAVASFVELNDFPRRLVATVDNLGRAHAPSAVWPVHPTAGRFSDGPDNAARYTPLVLLLEKVDSDAAADLYLRMYPLLQQEYTQLGYPHQEFNDRMLQVVRVLLATPEPEQPPAVELLEVKGPLASERPWVHYRFSDPALEGLSAGQKILLRVGVVNERRLKHKLTQFRDAVLARAKQR